jgi:hypothetical protein
MIKISLDEGYVFDLLSIHQVKMAKAKEPESLKKVVSAYWTLRDEIVSQIGQNKFNSILLGAEYDALYQANEKTFDLVDKAKESEGLAKEVDESNYERYLCKVNLQKKFFNNEVSETKIGYKQ